MDCTRIVWYCMVLYCSMRYFMVFLGISLYSNSIVLHGIACFILLHGIVCLTMCSITYSSNVKLWGLPRIVFTLFLSQNISLSWNCKNLLHHMC